MKERKAATQLGARTQRGKEHFRGPWLSPPPTDDEFFLSPLLTGGAIDLSATSLEMLSLMPLCLQSPKAPPPSLPGASTADQSTRGSDEKHYIIVKSIIITRRTYSNEGKNKLSHKNNA